MLQCLGKFGSNNKSIKKDFGSAIGNKTDVNSSRALADSSSISEIMPIFLRVVIPNENL